MIVEEQGKMPEPLTSDKDGVQIIHKTRSGIKLRSNDWMTFHAPIGAGKLGRYLPKDVLRVMEITKKGKAIVTPLSRRKMIVELYPE